MAIAAATALKEKQSKGADLPESITSDGVAERMGRLWLTAKESKTFVMKEEVDDAHGCPEWAIVGKGSPWVVGKNAILRKQFDRRVKPADVIFDRLLLGVRIDNLPYSIMNTKRGTPLAELIGNVDHLDMDETGRAGGSYLQAWINIEVNEPLMRCVAVESSSLNKTTFYEVKYENPPMYCFSCGLIGNSSLVCATPAERDEEGKLPWNSERVCVPDERKREARSSSRQGSNSGQGSSSNPVAKDKKGGEVTSPSKPPRKPRAKKQPASTGRETVVTGAGPRTGGQKCKQNMVYQPKFVKPTLAIENSPSTTSIPPHDIAETENGREASSDDSNKKHKNSESGSTLRSADPTAAVNQPRHSQ
ncbi:hypothetical protein ACQ4PT_036666 [Festuca glaucescens]